MLRDHEPDGVRQGRRELRQRKPVRVLRPLLHQQPRGVRQPGRIEPGSRQDARSCREVTMTTETATTGILTDRIFTPGLAQVAYLIADTESGEAAIIDPRRDVDAYVAWAKERGLRFVAILETHVHADFVSGGKELSRVTGAPIYAPRLGEVEYEHTPVDDGDVIHVGRARLKAVWTPGHTPEHIAFLLLPDPESEEPVALYSGDVLFVGDVGRPDLLGDEATERLSNQLYETVTERLKTLPDDVIVYPGHTAGSSCGKKIGDAPSTTIGAEKFGNYAF